MGGHDQLPVSDWAGYGTHAEHDLTPSGRTGRCSREFALGSATWANIACGLRQIYSGADCKAAGLTKLVPASARDI